MKEKEWRKRFKYRGDLSSRVIHLTKGNNSEEAFRRLINILEEKKIYGSTTKKGFICGSKPAVCLQETPLTAIAENLQYEDMMRKEKDGKIRYLGFGVRFQKTFIYKKGGRPVIYDNTDLAEQYLLESEHWRIVKLDLSNKYNLVDWTHEREWRVPNSLGFKYSDCEIILPTSKYYKKFIEYCLINDRIEILRKIRGIINISSVYY
ncbi:DUF2971 domain-containing protein [Lachnospiraceae bacterium MD308]|nr:DUF2971 domain-containing protein [Lachnospiraceae bacterium MD308]